MSDSSHVLYFTDLHVVTGKWIILCWYWQEFDDDRDADDAVYEMNGKELLGGR